MSIFPTMWFSVLQSPTSLLAQGMYVSDGDGGRPPRGFSYFLLHMPSSPRPYRRSSEECARFNVSLGASPSGAIASSGNCVATSSYPANWSIRCRSILGSKRLFAAPSATGRSPAALSTVSPPTVAQPCPARRFRRRGPGPPAGLQPMKGPP